MKTLWLKCEDEYSALIAIEWDEKDELCQYYAGRRDELADVLQSCFEKNMRTFAEVRSFYPDPNHGVEEDERRIATEEDISYFMKLKLQEKQ